MMPEKIVSRARHNSRVSRYVKRQTSKWMRRLAKRLREDAPRKVRHDGWTD